MTSITLGSIVRPVTDSPRATLFVFARGEVVREYPNGDVEVKWSYGDPQWRTRLERRDLKVAE